MVLSFHSFQVISAQRMERVSPLIRIACVACRVYECYLERLLDDCLQDGQLDETDLTLADLRKVSEAFSRVLETIHHKRVDYPGYDFNERRGDTGDSGLRVVKGAK